MTDRTAQRFISGKVNINVLLGFGFGVIFLSVMLGFAVFVPNPRPFQIRVFITVLALAAAGVGGVLPGYIEVRYKGLLRAGGAIALFVLVYRLQPVIEDNVIRFVPPKETPQPVVERYLAAIDVGNLTDAWSQIDPAAIGLVVQDQAEFETIYRNARTPLGAVEFRIQQGSAGAASIPGLPPGVFRATNFTTKFANDADCRTETVLVRATSDLTWRVYEHNVSPIQFPCPPSGSN